MIPPWYQGEPAVILYTGPSLASEIPALIAARAAGALRLFGMNNTYRDFPVLDGFTACDPAWWDHYGDDFRRLHPQTPAWHWDAGVAARFHVEHVAGLWADGLSANPNRLHYGHSSGYQALGIAVHCGCQPIYLVGFDMNYRADRPRHYFTDLSDEAGEYPLALRKHSTFDGLLKCYQTIADQADRPPIYNATPGSAFHGFPFAGWREHLDGHRRT